MACDTEKEKAFIIELFPDLAEDVILPILEKYQNSEDRVYRVVSHILVTSNKRRSSSSIQEVALCKRQKKITSSPIEVIELDDNSNNSDILFDSEYSPEKYNNLNSFDISEVENGLEFSSNLNLSQFGNTNKMESIEKDKEIIATIMSIFPDICEKYVSNEIYLARLSINNDNSIFNYLLDKLLSSNSNYPKKSEPIGFQHSEHNCVFKSVLKKPKIETVVRESEIDQYPFKVPSETVNMQHCQPSTSAFNLDENSQNSSFVFLQQESPKLFSLAIKEDSVKSDVIDNCPLSQLAMTILRVFPDIDPIHLRRICGSKINSPDIINEIITGLLESDYPRRELEESEDNLDIDEDDQYNNILDILPDIDPEFLRNKCAMLFDKPRLLKEFVEELIVSKNYPRLEECQRRQKLSAQQKQYTVNFSVEKFLEIIPNPDEYFTKENSTGDKTRIENSLIVLEFFKNKYNNLRVNTIREVYFYESDYNIIKTTEILDQMQANMKSKRQKRSLNIESITSIPILQKLTYIQHKEEIHNYLKQQNDLKIQKRIEAKKLGLLVMCGCCYDDEVMPEDSSTCPVGHLFCNCCIVQSIEIAFADNNVDCKCLVDCDEAFSIPLLQKILKPKLFSKIALRKQVEEVKSAGIEDLESCPFCEFVTIPTPGDKVFKCLNSDCMRESCRQCSQPSHIPFRCDEIEQPEELKARVFIENQMTEAMLRKCWKCGTKFMKEEGCNKMTCRCGAFMCYVCSKPVKDYSHFNGQGGTRMDLCPLYSDTKKLHIENVRQKADEALMELKKTNPDLKLKHDPLLGLSPAPKEDKVYKPGKQYRLQDVLNMFR